MSILKSLSILYLLLIKIQFFEQFFEHLQID